MAIINASLAFKKYSFSQKATFGTNVTTALELDATQTPPLFPDLPVPVATLNILSGNLFEAVQGLVNGGRNAKEAAKMANEAWDAAFTATAIYVSMASANNSQSVSLSGFIPTKGTREKKQIPGVAATFKATINGTKGAILAGAKTKVPRAIAHIVTALPPGATISYLENTAIITIGTENIYIGAFTGKGTELYNLDSAKPYAVSMFSVNAAGHGPATSPQQVVPQ